MWPVAELTDDVDVVVVGAGLAGLATARHLHARGVSVTVVEKADDTGGRIRTDRQDGFLLDRGFQLFNPAYPEAARVFDVDLLELQPFKAGVVVAMGDSRYVLGDPRRWPAATVSTLRAPVGSMREKIALARYALDVGYRPVQRITGGADISLAEAFAERHLGGGVESHVLQPFLSGVLADGTLDSSRRLGDLLMRAFVRGTPALPANGMRALPDQLVAALPTGTVHTGVTVQRCSGSEVLTDHGRIRARAVVVAADPRAACALIGLPTPPMRGLTTFYHRVTSPPTHVGVLHVDGDRRGPVVNTAVVSNAARTYARSGALIATTVLGRDGGEQMESLVREQAGLIYGADTRSWELVATYAVPYALPAQRPPFAVQQDVDLGEGLFVAGDHRDTASIQGALVSGRRAGTAVLAHLRG